MDSNISLKEKPAVGAEELGGYKEAKECGGIRSGEKKQRHSHEFILFVYPVFSCVAGVLVELTTGCHVQQGL